MLKTQSLWKDIREHFYSISASVEHGEQFYDYDELQGFLADLDKMKELSVAYYEACKEEEE